MHKRNAGFTLIELIMVIVLLGIISVYRVERGASSAEVTLPSQAQTMASDIRHAQVLATTWGQRLRLTVTAGTNGSYNVRCVTAGASPCNVSPVIDPATGSSFSTTLQKNAVLGGSPATLDFNSLGQPLDSAGASASASYTLSYGGSTETVAVAALTGYVTVTP